MNYLGIFFAIIWVILSIIDNFFNKYVMGEKSAIEHTFLRCLSTIPFILLFSLKNWNLKLEAIPYIFFYSIIDCANLLFRQIAVKSSNVVFVEALSKTKIIFSIIISYLFAIDILTTKQCILIMIFVFGLILTLDLKKIKTQGNLTWKTIILEIFSSILKSMKPFIMKVAINKELISTETLAFINIIFIVFLIFIIFKPKLNIKKISFKNYFLISIINGFSILISSYAYLYANANIVNAIGSTTVILMMFISFILYKKKYSILSILGCVISLISLIFLII